MTRHIMEAETFIKNRLDAFLKPNVGTLSGRNAPLIKTNDSYFCYSACGLFHCSRCRRNDSKKDAVSSWGLRTVGTKSRNSPLNWPGERTEEALLHAIKKQFKEECLSSQRKLVAFSSLFRLLVPTVLKPLDGSYGRDSIITCQWAS